VINFARILSLPLLAGHPKLKNDLRRPTMEEIGYRSTVFSLEGMVGSQREYIEWLVSECTMVDTPIDEILEVEAIELLATRLRTPLQIEQHLTLALEAAYRVAVKPVTTVIVESVLSKQIDDLEPTLTRHGYDVRGLAEQFNAKPAEIKLLFRGQLDPARWLRPPQASRELQEQLKLNCCFAGNLTQRDHVNYRSKCWRQGCHFEWIENERKMEVFCSYL
jgi:hypothetical protein